MPRLTADVCRAVLSCSVSALLLAPCAVGSPRGEADPPVVVNGHSYGRTVDRTAAWRRAGGDLISGFVNMYHLFVLRDATFKGYPYRGWFFGWSAVEANRNFGHGCDMVFAARAPALTGPWEVYCGGSRWDGTMNAALWKPVLVAQDKPYDSWHNGDPSVVKVGRRYYMAYSATGHNKDGIPYGQAGDKDSDLDCVMGAVSDDGLNWIRTRAPILIDTANLGAPPIRPGEYLHAEGCYARPSLRREGGAWRLWFDCYTGSDMPMVYAENRGDFMDPDDWKVLRGARNPVLANCPNPDVVRVGDVYFAYGDPGGYEPVEPDDPALRAKFLRPWATRKIMEAISLDGLRWCPLGYVERDPDGQATHVPCAFVDSEGGVSRIILTYGVQVFGSYFYDRIRLRQRSVTRADLAEYRALWRKVYGKAPR